VRSTRFFGLLVCWSHLRQFAADRDRALFAGGTAGRTGYGVEHAEGDSSKLVRLCCHWKARIAVYPLQRPHGLASCNGYSYVSVTPKREHVSEAGELVLLCRIPSQTAAESDQGLRDEPATGLAARPLVAGVVS
jgi:hypothetical protein